MKILAIGLIHKNNTDNQPIEYVYRTLIVFLSKIIFEYDFEI